MPKYIDLGVDGLADVIIHDDGTIEVNGYTNGSAHGMLKIKDGEVIETKGYVSEYFPDRSKPDYYYSTDKDNQ